MMRRFLCAVFCSAALVPGFGASAQGADPAFPDYDIAKVCRVQANYAYAATLGDLDHDRELEACSARERENRSSAQALWPLVSAKDATACLGLAEGRYGYLTRCLDGSRSIRLAR